MQTDTSQVASIGADESDGAAVARDDETTGRTPLGKPADGFDDRMEGSGMTSTALGTVDA